MKLNIAEKVIKVPIMDVGGMIEIRYPELEGEQEQTEKINEFLAEITDAYIKRTNTYQTKRMCFLRGQTEYIDDNFFSVFWEITERERGKTVLYKPFSFTFDFSKKRFCMLNYFLSRENESDVLKKCKAFFLQRKISFSKKDALYNFYLHENDIVFYKLDNEARTSVKFKYKRVDNLSNK